METVKGKMTNFLIFVTMHEKKMTDRQFCAVFNVD